MEQFFERVKSLFEKIPSKPKFLKDLGFSNSYIGFRYFLQGHRSKPSSQFMEKLSSEIGYEYVQIPIKKNEDGDNIIKELTTSFEADLKNHLKKYKGDTPPRSTKSKEKLDTVDEVIASFETKDVANPKATIDVSELF